MVIAGAQFRLFGPAPILGCFRLHFGGGVFRRPRAGQRGNHSPRPGHHCKYVETEVVRAIDRLGAATNRHSQSAELGGSGRQQFGGSLEKLRHRSVVKSEHLLPSETEIAMKRWHWRPGREGNERSLVFRIGLPNSMAWPDKSMDKDDPSVYSFAAGLRCPS